MTQSPTSVEPSTRQERPADVAPATPICVSDWYADLGAYSFPTIFLPLRDDEIAALVNGDTSGSQVSAVCQRLDHGIDSLPGSSFVHADACAPTDTPAFEDNDIAVKSGRAAWSLLIASQKVRDACAAGHTTRLALHPYRRMDRVREFRIFIRDGRVVGMSQYNLTRHFGRLAGRRDEIWNGGKELVSRIAHWLPRPNITVDTYLTSSGEQMILDLNPWGAPTSPLLFRDWDEYDWDSNPSLRLIPKPIDLKGEVEVSF